MAGIYDSVLPGYYQTDLADKRSRFEAELADPNVQSMVNQRVANEVGGQTEEEQQAFIESVMNRAASRGHTLAQEINDRNYFPSTSFKDRGGDYSELVTRVLRGSDVSNRATGNESGNVKSGGAPISMEGKGGERFVVENPDAGFQYSHIVEPKAANPYDAALAPPPGQAPAAPPGVDTERKPDPGAVDPADTALAAQLHKNIADAAAQGVYPHAEAYIESDPDARVAQLAREHMREEQRAGVVTPAMAEVMAKDYGKGYGPAGPEAPAKSLLERADDLLRTPSPDWLAQREAVVKRMIEGPTGPGEGEGGWWDKQWYTPKEIKAGDDMPDIDPVTNQPTGKTHKASGAEASITNMAKSFAGGLTSPRGLFNFIPPVFMAEMIKTSPDLIEKVKEADKTPAWSQERWDAGLAVVNTLLIAHGQAHGIVHGLTEVPKPKVSAEGPPSEAPTGEGVGPAVAPVTAVPTKGIVSETQRVNTSPATLEEERQANLAAGQQGGEPAPFEEPAAPRKVLASANVTAHGGPEERLEAIKRSIREGEKPRAGEHEEGDLGHAAMDMGDQMGRFPGVEKTAPPIELTKPPRTVREPLTLEELRLQKERDLLEVQNELSRRATGNTHPGVDERIAEIDKEMDAIANREAAPIHEDIPKGAPEPLQKEAPAKEPETNIGHKIGDEYKLTHEDVLKAAKSVGLKVTEHAELPETKDAERASYLKFESATPEQLEALREKTQQTSIPDSRGKMYVKPGEEAKAKAEGWDKFNEKYFRRPEEKLPEPTVPGGKVYKTESGDIVEEGAGGERQVRQPGLGIKSAMSAKGATDVLYEKAFEALKDGKTTISGVKDPILARHKAAFDRGEITSPEDLKIAEEGKGEGGITPEAKARAAKEPTEKGEAEVQHAYTEARLAEQGKEPPRKAEQGEISLTAKAKIEKKPHLPQELVDSVLKGDKGVFTGEEQEIVRQGATGLSRDVADLRDEINKETDPEKAANAQKRMEDAQQKLDDHMSALHLTRSELGGALGTHGPQDPVNFDRDTLKADFKARAAAGKKLTPKLEKQLDKAFEKMEKARQAVKDAKDQPEPMPRTAEGKRKWLRERRALSESVMDKEIRKLTNLGITPQQINLPLLAKEAAVWVASHAAEKGLDFAESLKVLPEKYAQFIAPFRDNVLDEARTVYKGMAEQGPIGRFIQEEKKLEVEHPELSAANVKVARNQDLFFSKHMAKLLEKTGLQGTPESIKLAAHRLVNDVHKWLKDNPEFSEYYDTDLKVGLEDIDKGLESQGLKKMSPEEHTLFRLLDGIWSNGTDLERNTWEAIEGLKHYRETGNLDDWTAKFTHEPTAKGGEPGWQWRVDKKGAFPLAGRGIPIKYLHTSIMNKLLREHGIEGTAKFLREMVPWDELKKEGQKYTKGGLGGKGPILNIVEGATGQKELVPRSFLFGKKVGAYTLNILGDHRFNTVDVWESRILAAQFKGFLEKNGGIATRGEEHNLYEDFIKNFNDTWAKEYGPQTSSALQAARWYFMKDAAKRAGWRITADKTISYYARDYFKQGVDLKSGELGSKEGGAVGQQAEPTLGPLSTRAKQLKPGSRSGQVGGIPVADKGTIFERARAFIEPLDSYADKGLAKLAARGPEFASGATLSPEAFKIGVANAARDIIHKGIDFAEFSAKMVKASGDWIKPHLAKMWDAANELVKTSTSILDDKARAKWFKRTMAAKEDFEQRIKEGNVGPKTRPRQKVEYTKEMVRAEAGLDRARQGYLDMIAKHKAKQRPFIIKALHAVGEAQAGIRAVMTSADASYIGRHGAFYAGTHPIEASKLFFGKGLKAITEKGYDELQTEGRLDPNSYRHKRSKLAQTDVNARLTNQEESMMGTWSKHIPIVKQSDQLFTSNINAARRNWWNYFANTLEKNGHTLSLNEEKVISNYVNVMTGRGSSDIRTIESLLHGMNSFAFAPRFRYSRLQLLALQPLWKGIGKGPVRAKLRLMMAREMATAAAPIAATRMMLKYGIATGALAGMGITLGSNDPTDKDYGKVIIDGKTRIDFSAGMLTQLRFAARMASIVNARLKGEKPAFDFERELLKYAESGLSPSAQSIFEYMKGKTFSGEKPSLRTRAEGALPMTVQDIKESIQKGGHNLPKNVIIGLLSWLGTSVNTYNDSAKGGGGRTSKSEPWKPAAGKRLPWETSKKKAPWE